VVLKKIPAENKTRLAQLAWFGGVALFFITLIFPIQFDRQWLTIGWALEGAGGPTVTQTGFLYLYSSTAQPVRLVVRLAIRCLLSRSGSRDR